MANWQHCGQPIAQIDPDLEAHESQPNAVTIDGNAYLIRSGHCVPYYESSGHNGETVEQTSRTRLNVELCNRVFRICDARDVIRSGEAADDAINKLQTLYESQESDQRRGTGKVLFGRITARIRDLSHHYISEADDVLLQKIERLYCYVMVSHPELFHCVRLYDGSQDHDGVIEEAFSEIGKPSRQSLISIYQSRASKIGAGMLGIHQVKQAMLQAATSAHPASSQQICHTIERFANVAAKLSGFPTFDAPIYDPTAIDYINKQDEIMAQLAQFNGDTLNHNLVDWLCDGVRLIDSILIIRDTRRNSIASFRQLGQQWRNC